jgi:hypothetical protein
MTKRTLTGTLETSDLPAAVAALDQDIVFHSPILVTTGNEVRGHTIVAKILQTAFAGYGMPRNVEEFQHPDGRYIVTFDGSIDGNLDPNRHPRNRERWQKDRKHPPVRAPMAGRQAFPPVHGAQPASGPGPRRHWETANNSCVTMDVQSSRVAKRLLNVIIGVRTAAITMAGQPAKD